MASDKPLSLPKPKPDAPSPKPETPSITPVVLLTIGNVVQAAVIVSYLFGSAGAGIPEPIFRARVDAMIEVQSELIRTLRIEVERLKRYRISSNPSCTGIVHDALDFLKAQVEERVKDAVKSEIKRLASHQFKNNIVNRAIECTEWEEPIDNTYSYR